MRSKYYFLAAGAIFLAIAAVELLHAHNYGATALNAFAGVIFIYLGIIPAKQK